MVDQAVLAGDASITVVVTSNGQVSFDFDFLVYDAGQVVAVHTTAAGVSTVLEAGVDFTVSGIAQEAGGSIDITGSGISTLIGETVLIYRSIPIQRLTDYSVEFRTFVVNREFDTIFMIMQEARRDIDRSWKSAFGAAGGLIGAGVSGNLVKYTATGLIDAGVSAAQVVQAATDAATAAGDAATAAGAAQAARDYAAAWATEAEDVAVDDGVNDPGFSAYHWAQKAEDNAAAVETSADPDFDVDPAKLATRATIKTFDAFKSDAVGALARPSLHKQRDIISALDLMSSGGLDEAIKNREAVAGDAPEITDLLQEIVTHAVSKKRALYIPGGLYFLDTKIVTAGPAVLRGDGVMGSILRWTSDAASEGIEIVSGSDWRTSHIEDMAIETLKAGVGQAVKFDYSGTISGGVSVPRAVSHAKLNKVGIRGATSYTTDGWLGGVDAVSCQGLDIDTCRINGYHVNPHGTMPTSVSGIKFGGAGAPVQLFVRNSLVSAWQEGCRIEDAEGCYLHNNEFVTVGTGIIADHAASEPLLSVTSMHIAAITKCIDLTNQAEFLIKGNALYPIGPQTGDFLGVHIQAGCSRGIVEGNSFVRSNVTSLYRGIVEDGGTETLIQGNTLSVGSSVGCIGIDLTANAVRPQVGRNVFPTAQLKIRNLASAARLDGWRVIANSGVAAAHTGNTTETALRTVTIPANSIGPNGILKVTALYSFTINANNKTPRIRLGGMSGSGLYSLAIASQGAVAILREVQNRNSASSQVFVPFGTTTSYGVIGAAAGTATQDTTTDLDLVFTGQLANSGDTITLESYTVEVLYRP
jgi:hypothetical protein